LEDRYFEMYQEVRTVIERFLEVLPIKDVETVRQYIHEDIRDYLEERQKRG